MATERKSQNQAAQQNNPLDAFPELKEKLGDAAKPEDIIEEMAKLLAERDRRLAVESEPTAILSAQIPVSLRDKVSDIAESHHGLSRKKIIVDALYLYLDENPKLVEEAQAYKEKQQS